MPGDAPIHLDAIRAEAEAEGQIHLGYGMSAGTRKIRVGRYPVADRGGGACLAADSMRPACILLVLIAIKYRPSGR